MLPANVLNVTAPQVAGANTAQKPKLLTSSRLAHLLKSNDAPLDSEIPAIRQIISTNQARVDVLNAQIEQLIKERDEKEEHVRKHAAVVSVVRRVPQELICGIFALTPCTRRIDEETVYCAPWRLGHICRSWRDWALADPFLWQSIELSSKHNGFDLCDISPLSMIETQLLRSGSVPLTATFDIRCGAEERPLWDLFLPLCDRWGTVRLHSWGQFSTLSDLLDVVWGRIPQLAKLELISSDPNHRDSLDLPNPFSIAPNLRNVILTDREYRRPSLPLCMPWGQITHYRGRFLAERQLEILEAASNLVQCGLGFLNNTFHISSDKVITLPHLRRLFVANGNFWPI